MQQLVRFCLRYRYAVVAVVSGLCILAFFDVRHTSIRVFPSFEPPVVKIITRVPGLTPRDIELSVTDMLERGLTGVSGLKSTLSRSEPGLSIITLIFQSHTSAAQDRKSVAGRLSELRPTLPPGAVAHIERPTSMIGVAAEIGVIGHGVSPLNVGQIVETRVVPELEATTGVAKVDVYDAATPILAIEPHLSALLATGVSLTDLANAAHRATAVSGLGSVNSPNQRLLIEGRGQTRASTALADSIVRQRGGRPLTIGMVAHVIKTRPPRVGAALINGRPGVVITVWAQHSGATSAVAARTLRKVRRLQRELHGRHVYILPNVFRPAAFSKVAVDHVLHLVELGSIAILGILVVALRDWRMVTVAYTPIIVSILGTLAALHFAGVPLNTLGLSGLAIALAEIVHDSVADSITTQRRLLRRPSGDTRPTRLQLILDAAVAVRSKVVVCALVTSILFLPVVVLPGFPGKLFAPIAITYITAIVMSVAVSLVFSPALAGILLADAGPGRPLPGPPRPLRRIYRWLIQPSKTVMMAEGALAAILFSAVAASAPFLSMTFLPAFSQRSLVLHLQTAPGTSLADTEHVVQTYVSTLRSVRGVEHTIALVGRARPSDHATHVNRATIDITTDSNNPRATQTIESAIMHALQCPAALQCTISTFMDHRVHQTLPDFSAPLMVSLTGLSSDAIGKAADRLEREIRPLPSVRKVELKPVLTRRTILGIKPIRHAMAQYGVTARKILTTVAAAYRGTPVASVYVRDYREPVELIAPRRDRSDPITLDRLPIRADDGRLVPLGLVAHVSFTRALGTIAQVNRDRVQRLLIWPRTGYSVRMLRRQVERLSGGHRRSSETAAHFTGTFRIVSRAVRAVLFRAAIALLIVVFLLWVLLAESRAIAILSLGLPVAVSGGIAMVWLFLQGTANFAVLIGLVALFGIALRNGLLLVFHYRTLSPSNESKVSPEHARTIAIEMLPVVLISATVAIAGLLPLAAYHGTAGDEIAGPLAAVIVGGLGTGTVLTALALPRILPLTLRLHYRQKNRSI